METAPRRARVTVPSRSALSQARATQALARYDGAKHGQGDYAHGPTVGAQTRYERIVFVQRRRTGTMRQVVRYIRVSTGKQGKSGLGIEAQRDAIARFAAAEGCEVVGE